MKCPQDWYQLARTDSNEFDRSASATFDPESVLARTGLTEFGRPTPATFDPEPALATTNSAEFGRPTSATVDPKSAMARMDATHVGHLRCEIGHVSISTRLGPDGARTGVGSKNMHGAMQKAHAGADSVWGRL